MSLIVQTVFANLIDWLFKPLDNLCSQLLTGAFGGLVGSMSNDEWNVAITAANRIGWIMGFVNMALCIIGALQAAAKGSVADVIKSFALAVLAWPLTAVCISVMITMDGIIGQITNRILTIPLAGVGTSDPFGDSVVSNLVGTIVKLTAGFDLIIRIVVYLVLFLAVLALAGMLAARDISLILLACVAPLPVMMTGWKVTRPAAAKWAQAVVGVLLSAPLSALVIMVGSGICYVAKNNPHYAESFFPALMGITTIIMACFSPKLIMPAVSFIGTNVAADMQERGGKVGPNAIKAAVQVTAGVVQAATAGATGGIGKAVNSGAEAVLGAAQGTPTWEERWAACSATRTKARIPTRPPVRKMVGKASRRPATMIPCLPPHNRPTLPEPPYRRRRTAWTVPVRARPWTPRPPTRATARPDPSRDRPPRLRLRPRPPLRPRPSCRELRAAVAAMRMPMAAKEAKARTAGREAKAPMVVWEPMAARAVPAAVAAMAVWEVPEAPERRTRIRESMARRPVRPSADGSPVIATCPRGRHAGGDPPIGSEDPGGFPPFVFSDGF